MKLYEISANLRSAMDYLTDPDNDIPLSAIADTMESLEGEFSDKAIQVAAFARELEAEAKAIKEEEDRMAKRRKEIEKKANSMLSYILQNMECVGLQRIKSPWFVMSVFKNPASIDIINVNDLPDDYVIMKVERIPDKTRIKESIKSGIDVPGARIVNGTRLSIR